MFTIFGKKRAAHLELGKTGEDIAQQMFRNQGYDILARDVRFPKGEIDLILRAGLSLVFAEVKTRRFKRLEDLRALQVDDVIRYRQKRRIYRAAFSYMKKIGNPSMPYQFDLVQVLFLKNSLYEIRHIQRAFGQRTFEHRRPVENLFR